MANLLRPWLLARLLGGAAAAALLGVAIVVAVRVLSEWREGSTGERQLVLERRAELVATLVQTALGLTLLGVALLLMAGDRAAESIRGAMCAWGVFDDTPGGFAALAASALAAYAGGLWLALHRLDLRVETPALTRLKFLAIFLVAPLVGLDLGASLRFALSLDFEMVASCCSVTLDGGGTSAWADSVLGRNGFHLALALGTLSGVLGLALARAPRPGLAFALGPLSTLSLATFVPAVLDVVAPHVYELPHHRCPFCLLHADVGGIGWPLFGAVFVASATGLGATLVESLRSRAGALATDATLRGLGKSAGIAWLLATALAAAPVARYVWITGTLLP